MANNGGNITFGIGFNVDKSGLNDLKKSLQDIQKATTKDLVGNLGSNEAKKALADVKRSASEIEQALRKAYNPTINATNISKFNQQLAKTGTDLNTVYQNFAKLGTTGQTAFTQLASNILTTNVRLKETHSLLDSMGQTMVNTVKWGIASSVMNTFTGSIQNAYNYIKVLDSSLTDIRIVTGQSREEMDRFAESANRAAQNLGRQTKDYTNAALSFYQQGLSEDEVAARTETTLKAANITGAGVSDMANQLTAVWNGFQIGIEDTENVVSKLAAVADTSASNMSELATAMSKTASVANNMGVDVDQLTAQIATIIATTRQAPETVGNALKTIYARINDIKAGSDEAEISLGNYTGKMAALGVQVLDQQGNLRNTGQVMEQIGQRWGSMTREQQIYLAQTMAGQRQMNNLIALFDNWDMYTKELNTSLEAQGTLDEKNARYMESLAAHVNQLTAAGEGLIQAFANGDSFKGFIDAGTTALSLLTDLVNSIGGGGNAILALGSIATSVFSNVIGKEINSLVTNFQNAKFNAEQLNQVIENTRSMAAIEGIGDNRAVQAMIDAQTETQKYYSVMSEAEINHQNELIKELGLAEQNRANWKANTEAAQEYAKAISGSDHIDILKQESQGFDELGYHIQHVQEYVIATQTALDNFRTNSSEESLSALTANMTQLLQTQDQTSKEAQRLAKAIQDVENPATRTKEAITELKAASQDFINITHGKVENLNTIFNDGGKSVQDYSNQISNLKAVIDSSNESFRQAFNIDNIVKAVGAVGQLTAALNSLSRIPSIWDDEKLTSAEKFRQIILNLTSAIPMLIYGYSKLNNVLKINQSLQATAIALSKKKQAQIIQQTTLNTILEKRIITLNGQRVKNVAALTAEQKATLSNMLAKDAMVQKTYQQVAANQALQASFGVLFIAITAAISIFALVSNHLEKVRQETIQTNKAIIDQAKASQEQADANKKIYESFSDLYDKYKQGLITKEELYQTTTELADAYDIQGGAIANLTGQYDALATAAKKARLEEIQNQLSSNQVALTAATQNLVREGRKGSGSLSLDGQRYSFAPKQGIFGSGYLLSDDSRAADIYSRATGAKRIQGQTTNINGMSFVSPEAFEALQVDYSDPQSIIDFYEKIQKAIEELNKAGLTSTKLYQDLQQQVSQTSEAYKEAISLLDNNQQLLLEKAVLNSNLKRANTERDFELSLNLIKEEFRKGIEQGLVRSDLDIDKVLEDYLKTLNIDTAKQYLVKKEIDAFSGLSQQVKEYLKGLPEEDRTLLFNAGIALDKYTTKNQLQNQKKILEADLGHLQVPIDIITNATETILAGKKLSKDVYESLEASFLPEFAAQLGGKDLFNSKTASEQLRILDQLIAKQKEYNRTAVENAQTLINANREVNEEYSAQIEAIVQDIEKLKALRAQPTIALHPEAQAEIDRQIAELEQKLQTLVENPYTVNIGMEIDDLGMSELNTSISQVIVNAERLQVAAELIGQGWRVAADDVGQFASVFPQLMKNAEFLEDGILQLDQNLVSTILGNNVEIINSNKEIAVQAIENKLEQLKAELDFEENKKSILQSLLDGEITEKGAEKAIAQETKDYQKQLEQMGVQVNAQATNAVIENAGIGAKGIIDYLQDVQTAIATINADYHNMLSGDVPVRSLSVSGSGVSASSGWKSSLSSQDFGRESKLVVEEYRQQIQSQINEASANISKLRGQISSLEGAEAKILKQSTEAATKVGYATQGLGGSYDPEKDKSKKSGSSSKDKTKTADQIEKKKLKDAQIDRYHELDRAIKDVQETIDDLNRAEGKTVRNGLSQTIDQQVAALEQQKGLYEQKIGLMQSDLQLMQSELSALGVQFDSQGNIVNYTALMIEYQRVYNGLLEEAKLLTGDQQQAKLNEAEAVKAKLDNLKSQMNAYEQLQDKIVDAGNAIQDIIDKEEELRIKQFKIQIDWQLDKAQAERDWNEFRKKVIDKIKEDDYLGQARARLQDFFSYYKPDGGGIIQELTEHVNRTRQEAEIIENGGVSSVYGTNQAQALEDLKHYNDELMKNLEDVQEIAKDIHDLYLDTIDKANDAFEEQIAAYEQIDNIIEHDLNLIQMLQPVDNEEQLEKYYDLRRDNNNQQIDFYRKEVDMWKRQMDAAERGSDEWKKFRDNWMESVTDLNSAVDAAVQNLLDKYHNTIQKIINDSKDQLMGGDWKKALDEWDRAKWFDDRYLDLGTRGTGVLDFVSEVNKAMQGLPAKQQQQLLKFMDSEVDKLNNLTKMRQIDLDIANKRLEVLQKQMALEDAQQNKTKLRLRRDSQGNYSYQYVADQDQVASKEQQLRDVLEELRQLTKQDMTQTIDEVENKVEEFYDKAKELTETYYYDQELLKQKLLELEEQYFGEQGYITMLGVDYNRMQGQLIASTGAQFAELLRQEGDALAAFLGLDTDNAMENSIWQSVLKLIGADSGEIPKLLTIFTTQVMQDNFNKMGKMNQDLLFGEGGMNPSWNTAIGNMASSYITLTNEVVLPAVAAMINATDVYANELQVLQQVAGISFANISQGIDYTIGETRQLIQDNGTLINSFEQEINAIAAVNAQIQALCAQYREAEAAAISAAEAAMNFWATANGVPAEVSSPSGGGYGGGGGEGGYEGKVFQKTNESPSGVASVQSTTSSSSNYQPREPLNYRTAITSNGSTIGFTGSGKHPESSTISEIEMRKFGYKTPKGAAHFATGGYTGEWINGNDDGRLAFLHQKELVLNAEDTSNILSAVDIVRKLTNQIAGLNGLAFSGLPNSNIGGITNNNGNAIEQSVVIHANFPDVSEAAQIKQAFDNLVNIAVMRANQR